MIRVDLHIHTEYSADCLTRCADVIRWAQRRRLDAVAITDHNTIEGAIALSGMSPVPIIVGEEVRTTRGEIIGLFLREEIPAQLSPSETVRIIHQQGGLVYLPHPMDRFRCSVHALKELMEIIKEVDIIETFNARVTFSLDNKRAGELARSCGLPCGAGSDAHQGFEIGRGYVEMPPFMDAGGFLESIRRGKVRGHLSSPLVHVGSTYARLAKGLMEDALSAR
ncbi:MAG TPA: PHP domain-containing protein [Anaerolineae bacterium]|nr:PHP domain-containing protein [Anaerolineae bacterium]